MSLLCPACGAELISGLLDWHYECGACGYEGASLKPHINEKSASAEVDELARENGLHALRKQNFWKISSKLRLLFADRAPSIKPVLLDVGCAHGWFLEANQDRFEVFGIEPDSVVANATQQRGLSLRVGFFPDVLDAHERFDVIAFNDVLEHIPDISGTLSACRSHLLPGGVIVINAPSRRGALYRISKVMARLGSPGAFRRMWQFGLPSPHVHYFSTRVVDLLAAQHGLKRCDVFPLDAVALSGLYQRIRGAKDVSALKAGAIALCVAVTLPMLKMLPSDIEVWVLKESSP